MLGVRQGDEISVRARGARAREALDALRALAAENFGDAPDDGRRPRSRARRATRRRACERLAAPARVTRAPRRRACRGTRLSGAPASAGIAIGPARRLVASEPPVAEQPAGAPAAERALLDAARAAARADLAAARALVQERGSVEEAEIFTAHALLLDDAALVEPARRAIDDGQLGGPAPGRRPRPRRRPRSARSTTPTCASAPSTSRTSPAACSRGWRACRRAARRRAPGIVVADELTPGEAAGLDPETAWAIATARGGPTGHAAILARALGIPAVVGLGPALLAIPEGTALVLDGERGHGRRSIPAPRRSPSTSAGATPRPLRARRCSRAPASRERCATAGGSRSSPNVGSPAEARLAVAQGAEGVGLLRTEFLFLDRATAPGEDEQVAVLSEIARALDGRRVIVRTLDAGADKPLPFLRQAPEDNPFLGLRGIRLSLAEPELFRTQLRAILRVAAEHPLALMFPMVATARGAARGACAARRGPRRAGQQRGARGRRDGRGARRSRCRRPRSRRRSTSSRSAPTTSRSTRWRRSAATRRSPGCSTSRCRRCSRSIATVTAAAAAHGRWVGVCGELAGDPEAAVLLAGLGVHELSMAASRIPAVKAALREADPEAAAAAAQRALPAASRTVPGTRWRAVASARPVAIPNVTRGGLRSARLLAAGTATRILLTPVVMGLILVGDDDEPTRSPPCCSASPAATDYVDGVLGAPLARHQQARLLPRHHGGQAARLRRADRAARRRSRLALDRRADRRPRARC